MKFTGFKIQFESEKIQMKYLTTGLNMQCFAKISHLNSVIKVFGLLHVLKPLSHAFCNNATVGHPCLICSFTSVNVMGFNGICMNWLKLGDLLCIVKVI